MMDFKKVFNRYADMYNMDDDERAAEYPRFESLFTKIRNSVCTCGQTELSIDNHKSDCEYRSTMPRTLELFGLGGW